MKKKKINFLFIKLIIMKSLLIISLLIAISFQAANISVDPETSFIKDSNGRIKIYHGINVVYKTVKK
jgi:hypothetical protein